MEGVRVVEALVVVPVRMVVTVEVTKAVDGEAVMSGGRSVFCLSLKGWLGEGVGNLTVRCWGPP